MSSFNVIRGNYELKKIVSLILVLTSVILLFSSCNSRSESTQPYVPAYSDPVQSQSEVESIADASSEEDVWPSEPLYSYELCKVESSDGYSMVVTAEVWAGKRGTGEDIPHPDDASRILSGRSNTSAVIPFKIILRNTTSNTEYSTRATVGFGALFFMTFGSNGSNEGGIFLDSASGWLNVNSSAGNVRTLSIDDFSGGNRRVVYGFVVVAQYYSPEYPNGNPSMICYYDQPEVPGKMMIMASIGNAQKTEYLYLEATDDCVNLVQ